jgi:hypothetical protein
MLRNATRPARRGGWLAIALLAAILVSPARQAGAQEPKVPLDGAPKWPSDECLQVCLDAYVSSAERCQQAHCTFFLFFTVWCDEAALDACMADASAAFSDCVAACLEAGS